MFGFIEMAENASSDEYPLDEWMATVKECKFLPEEDLKKLTELVSFVQWSVELSILFH